MCQNLLETLMKHLKMKEYKFIIIAIIIKETRLLTQKYQDLGSCVRQSLLLLYYNIINYRFKISYLDLNEVDTSSTGKHHKKHLTNVFVCELPGCKILLRYPMIDVPVCKPPDCIFMLRNNSVNWRIEASLYYILYDMNIDVTCFFNQLLSLN